MGRHSHKNKMGTKWAPMRWVRMTERPGATGMVEPLELRRQARRLRGGPTRTLRILAQLASELRR